MHKSPWLTYFQSSTNPKLSLICFPYAGGGGHIFASWKGLLPPSVDIIAINTPGRGARMMETPFRQMLPLVEALKPAILPILNRPFVFFGHSLGAAVAFELARSLRASQGPQPMKLIASGRRAPHVSNDGPPIYHLSDQDFIEEIRKKKGTPEEVLQNDELMALVLPMLKADFEVADTHQYVEQAPFDFPITYLWGKDDKPVNRNNDDAWGQHTRAQYQHHPFEGGHFFIHSAKEAVLALLSDEL